MSSLGVRKRNVQQLLAQHTDEALAPRAAPFAPIDSSSVVDEEAVDETCTLEQMNTNSFVFPSFCAVVMAAGEWHAVLCVHGGTCKC